MVWGNTWARTMTVCAELLTDKPCCYRSWETSIWQKVFQIQQSMLYNNHSTASLFTFDLLLSLPSNLESRWFRGFSHVLLALAQTSAWHSEWKNRYWFLTEFRQPSFMRPKRSQKPKTKLKSKLKRTRNVERSKNTPFLHMNLRNYVWPHCDLDLWPILTKI